MAVAADIVLSWYASVPKSLQGQFTRPTRFVQLPPARSYREQIASFGPSPVLGILAKFAPGVAPLRVALLGFSEGCQGVASLLRSRSDGGRIDSAIAIDGTYAAYVGDPKRNVLNPWSFAGWEAQARAAIHDGRMLTITGSQVQPKDPRTGQPTHSSASDFGGALWRSILGDAAGSLPPDFWRRKEDPPWVHAKGCAGNPQYCWPDLIVTEAPTSFAVQQGGLTVIGYSNLDPTGVGDHAYQAQRVLPLVIEKILAPRWNNQDPSSALTCFGPPPGSLHGFGDCTIPSNYLPEPTPASWEAAAAGQPSPSSNGLLRFILTAAAGFGLAYVGTRVLSSRRRG